MFSHHKKYLALAAAFQKNEISDGFEFLNASLCMGSSVEKQDLNAFFGITGEFNVV